MNVIKKTVVILFVSILAACSTDQEIFEEQNTSIESSLRTQEENPIVETIIQFEEHISESQREEIRYHLQSSGFLIDFQIIYIEPGPYVERWFNPNLGCIWDSRKKRFIKWDPIIEEYGPCPITPIGTLEDDGVIRIITDDLNNDDGHN